MSIHQVSEPFPRTVEGEFDKLVVGQVFQFRVGYDGFLSIFSYE